MGKEDFREISGSWRAPVRVRGPRAVFREPCSRAAHRGMTPMRGALDRLRDYWPTRPGRSTFVNSTVPSCSRSRTVISALSPSMSTSPKNW